MGSVITTTGLIVKGAYVNEWKPMQGGRWVNKYSILGTTIIDYAVWEVCGNTITADGYTRTHSTITHHEGVQLGDMTTRELPADVDALPYGEERICAVRTWHAANEAEARALVLQAYPEANQ